MKATRCFNEDALGLDDSVDSCRINAVFGIVT